MSATLLGIAGFLRFYLDAAHSRVIPSSEFTEGMTVDKDFFSARFLFGTPSERFELSDGGANSGELEKIRAKVIAVRLENPGVPDEIRIVLHHPLSPYVLAAALATLVGTFR